MIKIEVSIDPDNQQQVTAAHNFMKALGKPSGEAATKEVAKPASQPAPTNEKAAEVIEGLTVAELKKEVADITDVTLLRKMLQEEHDGKDRISAKDVISSRIEEVLDSEEAEEAEEEEETSEYSIEDVRMKLAEKVKDHRAVIKEKLDELGAKNVTTLGEEHYADFISFLEEL